MARDRLGRLHDPATPVSILGGSGNDTFTMATPLSATGIKIDGDGDGDGGGGVNTLVGPDIATTWTIGSGNGGTLGSVAFANVQNLVGGNGNFRQNRNGQNLILALNGGSRNPAAYAARLAALGGTPPQNGCCTPAQTCNGVDALSVLAKSRRMVVRSIMPSQITSSRRPRPTACATLPSDWPSR